MAKPSGILPKNVNPKGEAEAEKMSAFFVKVTQEKRSFFLTTMKASALARISYVSIRGKDSEEGAVQRTLNPMRINSLKDYALAGGDYAASIVLNWVNKKSSVSIKEGKQLLPIEANSAQIIDGQHRVAGLREAIKTRSEVGNVEIPVAIYLLLDTQSCADIFLSINTEQRPVPKSLVFDLYGIASEERVDSAILRARDIATILSQDKDSPYFNLIRFPGATKGQLGVDLSTAVTAIKPLVIDKGVLEAIEIVELEMQARVIINYLQVIRSWYGPQWESKDNAFLSAAGFTGALDFFTQKLIPYCNANLDFTSQFIASSLKFSGQDLVKRSDLKGMAGSAASRAIATTLSGYFQPQSSKVGKIAI